MAKPVLIISIPKSGTHIARAIVVGLGFKDGRTLFREDYMRRSGALERTPLDAAMRTVDSRAVYQSHLRCTLRIVDCTTVFQRLFIHRDLRECLVSRYRHVCDRRMPMADEWSGRPGRDFHRFLKRRGGSDLDYARQMVAWQDVSGVLAVGHRALARGSSSFAGAIRNVARHIGAPEPADSERFAREIWRQHTPSRNARPTRLEDWWDDRAERWFARNGGHEVNRSVGYGVIGSDMQ